MHFGHKYVTLPPQIFSLLPKLSLALQKFRSHNVPACRKPFTRRKKTLLQRLFNRCTIFLLGHLHTGKSCINASASVLPEKAWSSISAQSDILVTFECFYLQNISKNCELSSNSSNIFLCYSEIGLLIGDCKYPFIIFRSTSCIWDIFCYFLEGKRRVLKRTELYQLGSGRVRV